MGAHVSLITAHTRTGIYRRVAVAVFQMVFGADVWCFALGAGSTTRARWPTSSTCLADVPYFYCGRSIYFGVEYFGRPPTQPKLQSLHPTFHFPVRAPVSLPAKALAGCAGGCPTRARLRDLLDGIPPSIPQCVQTLRMSNTTTTCCCDPPIVLVGVTGRATTWTLVHYTDL